MSENKCPCCGCPMKETYLGFVCPADNCAFRCSTNSLPRIAAAMDAEARRNALVEAAKPVAAWWRKERMVAEPPYQTEHVVLGTDGPECVGVDELDALAALVGEG